MLTGQICWFYLMMKRMKNAATAFLIHYGYSILILLRLIYKKEHVDDCDEMITSMRSIQE